MVAIIQFVFFVLSGLLQLLIWAIIISAVVSWLVAFNVINLRHPVVYNIVRMLEGVSRPVLAPFQRFIPPLGTVDISPIVAILVLVGIRSILLPAAEGALIGLLQPNAGL